MLETLFLLIAGHSLADAVLQSESMNIPQISIKVDSTNPNSEAQTLEEILIKAKDEFGIQGIVHGGILSEFQRKHFEKISQSLGITLISPLWKKNEKEHMQDLLESKFHFIRLLIYLPDLVLES